jgi:hypothetical protein
MLYQGCWTYGSHARTKCRAKRFPLHAAFTVILIFLFLWPDRRLHIVRNMCIYTHVWLCSVDIQIRYRCYQTTLRVKHFYTNWERCEVLTGYLQMRRQLNGDWTNTWHRTKHFTIFFANTSSSSHSYVRIFFLIAIIQEAFVRNTVILLRINYTI